MLSVVSCNYSGIVDGAKVKFVRPSKVVSLQADSTFNYEMPEVLNCLYLEIVNDTILVVQDRVSEENPYHFKAYSTKTFEYLGAFIRNGRGPGEMLSPHMRLSTNESCLIVNDNSLAISVEVNVEESLEQHRTEIVQNYALPNRTIVWLPLPDSRKFIMQSENGKTSFSTIGCNGKIIKTFDLYKEYSDDSYVTHLSSTFHNNGKTYEVAEIMVFFPQINFIDTENGHVRSVAVNKNYRRWKSVMNRMLDMDTIEYYVGVTSTKEYIFAKYRGLPWIRREGETQCSHIHIFDWEGHFLYDINVSENLGNITFDERTKYLYGVNIIDGRIVRYDFSDLI